MSTRASDTSLASFVTEHPLHYLWGLLADVLCGLYTFFFGILAILSARLFHSQRGVDFIGWLWSTLILRTCGITVEVIGAERLQPGRSYVIVSNHLSFFDIFATAATLPRVRFVAKKELLKAPVFGRALELSDHIVIDRKDPQSAIATIERAVRNAPDGIRILFYAEGTRSPDGKVQEFKKGGVSLALRAGLPIVPLSVSGTRKFLPKRAAIVRPGGKIRLVYGEPIETKGMPFEARDELNERVRRAVIANYIEDY